MYTVVYTDSSSHGTVLKVYTDIHIRSAALAFRATVGAESFLGNFPACEMYQLSIMQRFNVFKEKSTLLRYLVFWL